MTIKQLAAELNVSKPTIRKIITKLGFWDDICKVGNRYVLSEEQISQIKSRIEPVKSETEPVKSETTNQNALIEVLQKHLSLLNEQLSIKDDQIRTYQEQIRLLQDQLISKDRQIEQLTTAMENTTAALTASQALHAGTIQRQLTEQNSNKENTAPDDPEQPKQKQGFFSKFFGKKNN